MGLILLYCRIHIVLVELRKRPRLQLLFSAMLKEQICVAHNASLKSQ